MTTPQQSKANLAVVTGEAVADAGYLFDNLQGSPDAVRGSLLDNVPGVISYYAVGTGTLAADFYDERRELAGAKKTYTSEVIINDRTVKIRRAVAWATSPMFAPSTVTEAELADVVRKRLAEVVQTEVATPYRDTILTNSHNDPASVGWQRVLGDACRFCRMLADRGAVYKEATARFAAHPHCDCSAMPVFDGVVSFGPEASPMQYQASRRSKTAKQKAEIKAYLDAVYPL